MQPNDPDIDQKSVSEQIISTHMESVADSIRRLCRRIAIVMTGFVIVTAIVTFTVLGLTGLSNDQLTHNLSVLWIGTAAATICNALLRGTPARLAITAIGLLSLAALVVTHHEASIDDTNILIVAAIICTGFGLEAVLSGLTTIASAEEEIASAKVRELAAARGQQFERDEAFRISRSLHDRAANTLHSAALATHNGTELRARCAQDLALLKASLNATIPKPDESDHSIDQLCAIALDHARRLAVDLNLRRVGPDRQLGKASAQHVESLIVEALTNTAKHVPGKSATLQIDSTSTDLRIAITDSGQGWRWSAQDSQHYGTRNALRDELYRDGVTVAYSNRWTNSIGHASSDSSTASPDSLETQGVPSTGLTIRIDVKPTNPDRASERFNAGFSMTDLAIVPMARGIAFWLVGYCLIVMITTWTRLPAWWWIILATLGTGTAMTLINWAGRRDLPRTATLAGSVTTAAVLCFATLSDPLSVAWLCILPAALIAVMATWLSRPSDSWLPLTGLTAGLLISTAVLQRNGQSITAISSALWVVSTLALIGFIRLRRRVSEYDLVINRQLQELVAIQTEQATQASRTRARNLILSRCLSEVEPIFEKISNDTATFDPGFVSEIRGCEQLLRSAIALGANLTPLSSALLGLLWTCHIQGIAFEVLANGEEADPGQERSMEFVGYLRSLIESAPSHGGKISLTSYLTGDAGGILAAVELPTDSDFTEVSAPGWIHTSQAPGEPLVVEGDWQLSTTFKS